MFELRGLCISLRRGALASLLLLFVVAFLPSVAAQDDTPPPRILRVVLDDAIGPVTARFLVDQIQRAEETGCAAFVLELDTPGGLDASMRTIVKAILAARVPVIVYVAPPGARAASAGFFLTIAAPVAAMSPGTNIGAASPVGLGGGPAAADTTMAHKVLNDAVAYARSLAEQRDRNPDWAERAVRDGAAVSADEALELGVVDFVAPSLDSLLRAIDGRTVEVAGGDQVLSVRGAQVETGAMSGRDRLLALLTNPSIAYLLFLAGIMGIALELYNPGSILPGVVGGISLILAFFALQQLPVNVAGILLILLSVVLFLLEIKVPSYGLLSIGGVTSLVLGSLFLYRADSMVRVSLAVLMPTAILFSLFFAFLVAMAARAQHRRKLTGAEGMVGEIGEANTDLDPRGRVFVHGEHWNALSRVRVPAGSRVRVLHVKGLEVEVEPAPAEEGEPPSPQG